MQIRIFEPGKELPAGCSAHLCVGGPLDGAQVETSNNEPFLVNAGLGKKGEYNLSDGAFQWSKAPKRLEKA